MILSRKERRVMKVWVTRDMEEGQACVEMWHDRPRKYKWMVGAKGQFYYDGARGCDMEYGNFRKFFGFTPRKGSCKQYELTLKEIS